MNPHFVGGRDLANHAMQRRYDPAVMAQHWPVEQEEEEDDDE
jgi:hypothetical protein